MKVKGTKETQTREEERTTRKEAQAESGEGDHRSHMTAAPSISLTPERQVFIDILEEEIQRDLSDPLFKVLAEDADFHRTLDAICKRIVRRAAVDYSWEDLKQDVLIKFGRWLWRCRYEASFKTMLGTIARNQFIDMLRQSHEQCLSLEELLPGEDDVKFEPQAPRALMDIQDNIQVHEWLEALEEHEQKLFVWHHLEGRSLSDFARQRGVSRQAVDKQWLRILNKLRPLVENCI